jgi:CDP-paratose 2-epimerase
MRVFITGICGFTGRILAEVIAAAGHEVSGLDNFSRTGSRSNLEPLRRAGISVHDRDIRDAKAFDGLGKIDWVVDAAADASVLAGLDHASPSRRLVDINLFGTVNVLEFCKKAGAGLILLSTNRVYSIEALARLKLKTVDRAFCLAAAKSWPPGLSEKGVSEDFSTAAPISLYGACKLASEIVAAEYSATFGFPVWINRCGLLSGAGQFGTPAQGIVGFWIHAWLRNYPLRYTNFGGKGHQVRDLLHPRDLADLMLKQMAEPAKKAPRLVNVAGGQDSAISLRQLSDWCTARFGARDVVPDPTPRAFDLPWIVTDSSRARRAWNWRPAVKRDILLEEIAAHAEANPGWLALSGITENRR